MAKHYQETKRIVNPLSMPLPYDDLGGWDGMVCSTCSLDSLNLYENYTNRLTGDKCKYCGRKHTIVQETCNGCGAPL